MKTSLLICATCLLVTGCSAQFRLPSLSSALSSLTGFGSSSSGSGSGSGGSQASQSASSAYGGLMRDYGRNLMMAMSSIYPTLFKPPQQQQAQPQQQPAQSPFEQFSASQSMPSQSLFSGQSGPSFSFGGSTFSISPSFPFGSFQQQQQQPQQQAQQGPPPPQQFGQAAPSQGMGAGSHSPFSASFGSSINSPPSFGPLSSSPFLSQSMASFAPASSYNAAFEAANGQAGPSSGGSAASSSMGSPMFASMGQPGPMTASGSSGSSGFGQFGGPSGGNQVSSYPQMQGFSGQHDSQAQLLSQPSHHQAQTVSSGAHQVPSGLFGQAPSQQNQAPMGQQYANSQQFRSDMMPMPAASAPVPSSSSYSNYGNSQAQQGQAPSAASYQQPSYR